MTPRTASLGVLAFAALLVLSSVAGAAASGGTPDGSGPVDDCATAERATTAEESDPAVSLASDTVRVERGGTTQITVEMNGTDTGYLVIGAGGDPPYRNTFELTDTDGDGEVTVRLDTDGTEYVQPRGADDVDTVPDDTSLPLPKYLPRGEYDLRVAADREAARSDPQDVATLHVEPRPTAGVRLWRLDGVESNASSEAVRQAVSDENLSRPLTIGPDEWLVAEIDASGLEGLLANRSEATLTERFVGAVADDELEFDVRQTATNVPQLDPKRLNLTAVRAADALVVVPKQGSDGYYVALDTGADVLDRGGGRFHSLDFETDEHYELTYTAPREDPTNTEAKHSASGTFDTHQTRSSLDRDRWTFEAAENQSITGTTNLEPETELTVRIESDDPANPLVERERLTVRDNGTFAAQFDLSSLPPGTNLTIRLADPSGPADEAVGRIPAPPRFTVADLGAPETAAPGETVAVAATVTNAGDRAGETTVTVGTGDWTPANRTVALDPGESTTVTLRFDVPETTPERTYAFAIETANESLAFEVDVAAGGSATTRAVTPTRTTVPKDSTPTATTTGDDRAVTTTTPTATDGELSGFTPALSLLVLLAATLLALRRR